DPSWSRGRCVASRTCERCDHERAFVPCGATRMESLRIERLRTPPAVGGITGRRAWKRIWRERCFFRAILARRGISLVLLFALLATGGLLFQVLEQEKGHTFVRSMYFT